MKKKTTSKKATSKTKKPARRTNWKPAKEKQTDHIMFMVTPQDKEIIKRYAKAQRRTMSAFILQTLFAEIEKGQRAHHEDL